MKMKIVEKKDWAGGGGGGTLRNRPVQCDSFRPPASLRAALLSKITWHRPEILAWRFVDVSLSRLHLGLCQYSFPYSSMALPTNGRVIIDTTAGEIDIELWAKVCSCILNPCVYSLSPRRRHRKHAGISLRLPWKARFTHSFCPLIQADCLFQGTTTVLYSIGEHTRLLLESRD